MKIAVLYASSRRGGNSERLAKVLVEGMDVDSIFLTDYRIEPIIDYRHTEQGSYPEDDYRKLLDRGAQAGPPDLRHPHLLVRDAGAFEALHRPLVPIPAGKPEGFSRQDSGKKGVCPGRGR